MTRIVISACCPLADGNPIGKCRSLNMGLRKELSPPTSHPLKIQLKDESCPKSLKDTSDKQSRIREWAAQRLTVTWNQPSIKTFNGGSCIRKFWCEMFQA